MLTSPATVRVALRGPTTGRCSWALLVTFVLIIAFRGLRRRHRPQAHPARRASTAPGASCSRQDIVDRRRVWYWRTSFRRLFWLRARRRRHRVALLLRAAAARRATSLNAIPQLRASPASSFGLQLPLFFLINFLILFGPLLFFGLKQMKGYEPGDADWGVKLERRPRPGRAQGGGHERHRAVVGRARSSAKAGGKRERGLLFIGAPGTGKTMLSKAHRDVVQLADRDHAGLGLRADVHRHGRRHRHVPHPQGARARPQVGRHSASSSSTRSTPSACAARRCRAAQRRLPGRSTTGSRGAADSTGRWGALTSTGDLDPRDPASGATGCSRRAREPPAVGRDRPARAPCATASRAHVPGHGRHGRRAGAQPAAGADGRRRRAAVHAQVLHQPHQHVPRRDLHRPAADRQAARCASSRPSRAPSRSTSSAPPTSRSTSLDPALIRPGRMGRHIWFRTPTKDDRKDIFDLYLDQGRATTRTSTRDRAPRRARAHHQRLLAGHDRAGLLDGADLRALRGPRGSSTGKDIVEAMTTIESGTAQSASNYIDRRDARGRHPRGRPRGRQPRLHERRALHAAVDPQARRLARPPPGDREGGALLELAPRGGRQPRLDARRDGRRARLLRRELDRRGRRRPERHLARVACMVGVCGMGPEPLDLRGRVAKERRPRSRRSSWSASSASGCRS